MATTTTFKTTDQGEAIRFRAAWLEASEAEGVENYRNEDGRWTWTFVIEGVALAARLYDGDRPLTGNPQYFIGEDRADAERMIAEAVQDGPATRAAAMPVGVAS